MRTGCLHTSNMAEDDGEGRGGIYKGLIFPVTIEECLKDILVVCLKDGSTTYRGVLLDANKSPMPYGRGFDLLKLQCVGKKTAGLTESVDPEKEDQAPQVSALSHRHTYQQDENSVDRSLIPPAPVGINRPLCGKNVRSMRLRPRQVLCSKCKTRVGDNNKPSTASTNGGSHSTSHEPPVPIKSNSIKPTLLKVPPNMNPAVQLTKLDLRKRKFLTDLSTDYSPKKTKTDSRSSSPAKTSPVIKISFASPRGGRGTVVKIPAKIKHENFSENEDSNAHKDDQVEKDKREEYKKLKKARKRAKLLEKCNTEEGVSKHHHKKSKRNKHKKKKRHKDTDVCETEGKACVPNNSDYENDTDPLNLDKDVEHEPEDKPEDWTVVNDFLKSTENSPHRSPHRSPHKSPHKSPHVISLKENSQNVPLKGKIARTFTSLPIRDDRPSFESSRMSTSSGNSDRSSEYDVNSDCESEGGAPGEHVDCVKLEDSHEHEGKIEPLMMRIRTRTVSKCLTEEGRTVCIGDVVWGKIHGFPWWPGRVTSISISQRDGYVLSQTASVSWFGSSTMSIMPCSEIHPFLQDFELRYNKKKKGPYKTAIRQACNAAQTVTSAAQPLLED